MSEKNSRSIRNVYVLHSYNGDTEQGLLPGIEEICAGLDLPVTFPHFPIREEATYESWSEVMDGEISLGMFGENTVIITHSLSTLFVPRYMSEHDIKIGGYISCAGFLDGPEIEPGASVSEHRKRFHIGDGDMEKFETLCPYRHCLYGAHDQHNPEEKMSAYADAMGAEKHYLSNTGHMGKDEEDFSEALTAIGQALNDIASQSRAR